MYILYLLTEGHIPLQNKMQQTMGKPNFKNVKVV